MSRIEYTRGDVSLTRVGHGPTTQWTFAVAGQLSGPPQALIINEASTLSDLKLIIGQVEHAAKSLGEDVE